MLSVATTPVQFAEHVSRTLGHDVFVKRDDRTNARYGGNKVRKLVRFLADARTRGATDIVTLGAVGSHHVLATTIHGSAQGFAVHAVVVPQPRTAHVEQTVRADLVEGAHLVASAPSLGGFRRASLGSSQTCVRVSAASHISSGLAAARPSVPPGTWTPSPSCASSINAKTSPRGPTT